MFHLHNPSARSRTTVHKVKNPYDQERYMSWLSMFLSNNYNYGRYIYFFVDPPHLLKTVRNCWANGKRRLWVMDNYAALHLFLTTQVNGKEILWSHLVDLYYNNRSKSNPGLALIPKLKYEHVNLTSFSKMRVDLAAQVSFSLSTLP